MNFGEREGKAKAKHRGRVLEKVYYVFFFNNILLMWKIVGALKVSVLYVYIDYPNVHEIYTIKYSHIYIFSLTFMLFCD